MVSARVQNAHQQGAFRSECERSDVRLPSQEEQRSLVGVLAAPSGAFSAVRALRWQFSQGPDIASNCRLAPEQR